MNLEAKIKGEIMTMKRFLLVLLCVAASCAWAKGTPKGLLIMIDGVRSDALFHAATPNLDGLIAGRWAPAYHGAYTGAAGAIPDADPNSAPNHVSILTGVTAARHGVTYNGKTRDGAYDKFPTILSRLSRHRPELSTLFAFEWGEDADIALLEDFPRMQNPDTVNAEKLSRLLGEANAPDLVVWYIKVFIMSLLGVVLVFLSAFLHADWNFISKKCHSSAAFFLFMSISNAILWSWALWAYSDLWTGLSWKFWLLWGASSLAECIYCVGLARAYRVMCAKLRENGLMSL